MTNIVHEVWKILDNNPCIRRNLSCGLINQSALARYLIKEKKIKGTLDGVTSAIRRYKLDRYKEVFGIASKVINQSIISTKSRLTNIAVLKDAEVQEILPELFSIIAYNRGDVLRIIQADESIKILIDENNLEKIKKVIPENKIIKIDRNLAEINMHLHPEAVNTPGIISVISSELAMNDINVMETMSCVPEMLWFVKEEDILRAYNVLHLLCSSNLK